jgi:hypothetical protein
VKAFTVLSFIFTICSVGWSQTTQSVADIDITVTLHQVIPNFDDFDYKKDTRIHLDTLPPNSIPHLLHMMSSSSAITSFVWGEEGQIRVKTSYANIRRNPLTTWQVHNTGLFAYLNDVPVEEVFGSLVDITKPGRQTVWLNLSNGNDTIPPLAVIVNMLYRENFIQTLVTNSDTAVFYPNGQLQYRALHEMGSMIYGGGGGAVQRRPGGKRSYVKARKTWTYEEDGTLLKKTKWKKKK